MPAFSFTKQKKQPSFVKFDLTTPTVGKYNVSEIKFNSRLKTAPSVSLTRAKRYNSQKKVVPGPGAYQLETQKEKSQKGITMKGTRQLKVKTQGPGPLSYDPKVQFPTKKFSFPKSSQKKLALQGPDPATYNVKFDVLNSTSNYVFSKSERQPLQKKDWMKNVGPGCHQVIRESLAEQKYQFSFTKTQKFKDEKIQTKEKSIIPGPGKYDIKNARQTHSSIKFALAAKTMQVKEEVPGVGAYNVLEKQNTLKNGIKIGKVSRQKDYATFTPGPGAYETQVLIKLKSKETSNIVFPKSPRMRSSSYSSSVGPGKYNVGQDNESIAKRKGFTIASKTFKEKVDFTPGPQSYNPDFKKIYQSCQRSVFGRSKKNSLSLSKTPGPGAYELKQKKFSKTFYFNKANQRSEQNKSENKIGPGQYKLKPFFGEFDGKEKLRVKTETVYV